MLRLFSLLIASSLLLPSGQSFARTQSPFVSRAEAAMILLQSSGKQIADRKNDGKYADLIDGQWEVRYMLGAIDHKMIDPDPEKELVYPHRHATRAEFLRMMSSAFALPLNLPSPYADVDKDAWYAPFVGFAAAYSIFPDADRPGLLLPNNRLTHKQAMEAIHALFAARPELQPAQKVPLLRPLGAMIGSSNPVRTVGNIGPEDVKKSLLNILQPSSLSNALKTKEDLLRRINEERVGAGLHPLRYSTYLEGAAQKHAKDMSQRGYFSHFTPEGMSYVDRIRAAGYLESGKHLCGCTQALDVRDAETRKSLAEKGPDYLVAGEEVCECQPRFALGENIARGQLGVKQVMEDWLLSQHHRENLLRPEFDEIGIGLFGNIWVQNFGALKR